MLTAFLVLQIVTAAPSVDPFVFFQPSVSIAAGDRRLLDRGEPIARVLPGQDREVAVFAAVPVNINGERLVAWIRRIEEVKKSAYVLAIHRFSNPPRIEDLADLVFDDTEVSELRACRPGHCALNLSPAEAGELASSESSDAAQHAFRSILLRRASAYLTDSGAASAGPVATDSQAADLAALVHHSTFLSDRLPRFASDLGHARHTAMPDVESFLYWSKEQLTGKPIIGLTEVNIWRANEVGFPEVLVAGKMFFATHYIRASLALTALMRGDPGGPNYLVYVNRSDVDVLGGVFGGIVRWLMERRLKAKAADVLQGLRQRLESGEPPPAVVAGVR